MVVFNKECLEVIENLRQSKGMPTMGWSEISQHKKESDCYIVVEKCVFDVTDYMTRHPGGRVAILRHSGKDATTFFDRIGSHTSSARKTLAKLYVADVQQMSLLPRMGGGKSKGGKGGSSSDCSCVLC